MSRTMSLSTRSSSAHPPFSHTNDTRNNPALSAALASHKQPLPTPPPRRLTKNGFVSSGALAAAARAGTGQGTSPNAGVGTRYSGPKAQPVEYRPLVPPRKGSAISLSPSGAALGSHEPAPSLSPSFRQSSPSHIAAVRATQKSTMPGAPGAVRARSSPPRQDPALERKDETPIPATNKLVELFEARAKHGDAAIKPVTATGPTVVLSPKPMRTASIKKVTGESERAPSQPTKAPAVSPPRSLPGSQNHPNIIPSYDLGTQGAQPLSRSPSRNTAQTRRDSQASISRASVRKGYSPALKPRVRSISLDRTVSSTGSTPYATPLGSPAERPRLRPSPSDRSMTTQMAVPRGGRREMSRPRSSYMPSKVQPQLNVNALANAMVASSLASSRAPSPHKSSPPNPYKFPPPPPPARKGGKTAAMSFLISHHSGPARMPARPLSPPKTTLKQTLRKQPTGPEEEKRGKPAAHDGRGGKLRKHVPGLARPGSLDQVDLADRKLYEGVWAANRGVLATEEELHPQPPPTQGQRPKAADEVHGLVVKDIWKRSGLESNLLEQIWHLVDGAEGVKRSQPGRLDRVEFVVGLWLVDQALMGRKLPRRLPESVWESVRVGPAMTFRR